MCLASINETKTLDININKAYVMLFDENVTFYKNITPKIKGETIKNISDNLMSIIIAITIEPISRNGVRITFLKKEETAV